MTSILITGSAGFIGSHLVERLCKENISIVGIDNLNPYYDVKLKYHRLEQNGILKAAISPQKIVLSRTQKNYCFIHADLLDLRYLDLLFEKYQFDYVFHLAAQAGVRYSLEQPKVYIESNIVGTYHILEACRKVSVKHLIYASSSSVYGLNTSQPFSVQDNVDHPISLYAASKKSNELMAHTYSHLYQLPTTGVRFFTVYGPLGRPDMAYFKFTEAIFSGNPIEVYNFGKMKRDFTYIDDIIEILCRIWKKSPIQNGSWNFDHPNPATSPSPYRILNAGNNTPVNLVDFIEIIEDVIGKKATKNKRPIQDGDVPETFADISDLIELTGYKPKTSLRDGIASFISWYQSYYKK